MIYGQYIKIRNLLLFLSLYIHFVMAELFTDDLWHNIDKI